MKRATRFRRHTNSRAGTTVVETAIVLPVFLLFVLALMELGHAQMVKHMLRASCRQAARMGTTEGNTTADVQARVLETLGTVVPTDSVQLYVKNASVYDEGGSTPTTGSQIESLPDIQLDEAEPRTLFVVRAKIAYEDIAIIPNIPILGAFLDEVVLEGQAFMRHE
jgi:hypothetical protein